ncbi:MAG: hypothetical protein ACREEM_25685 [Blastocatellia bacterium]
MIDTKTYTIVNRIFGIPTSRDLVFSPDGKQVYVTNGGVNGTVVVVDTATPTERTTIRVGNDPEKIVISPDGEYLYVVNTGSLANPDDVSVISTSSNTEIRRITVGRDAMGAVISRDGSRLYVVNNEVSKDSGTVSVIDTGNGGERGVIATFDVLARPSWVTISPDGKRLYVVRQGINQGGVLVEVDTANGAVGRSLTFSFRANSIAISQDGAFLYVPLNGGTPNTVAEVSVSPLAITRHFGVEREPNGVALSPLQGGLSTANAASFGLGPLAAEAIGAIFGANLAGSVQAASGQPLPTSLAGTAVKVRDRAGNERPAPLFFVSPGQVNYQMPPGTADGIADITVSHTHGFVAAGSKEIARISPGIFTANADGKGVPAAVIFRRRADGSERYEPVARFDAAQNRYVPLPIDLGPESDGVFLILYGTGIRFRGALSAVTVTIGGIGSQVLFAGMAPDFVGLDQVNVRLDRRLAGRGEVVINLQVDGQLANTVQVGIR